jgi:hypothetical protein
MSLFLKEGNGRLALHYRFCESTMIMRQDEVTKAQNVKVAKAANLIFAALATV